MGNKLVNKVAVVTGATSGIGSAVAERFAQEGAKVVFCGRRQEKGQKLEAALKAKGYDVMFVKADTTVEAEVKNLMDKAVERYGSLDILVNNAGVLTMFQFENFDMVKDYDNVMDTNVKAYFTCAKHALAHMLKQGKGNIINTASVGALNGGPGLVSYCTSKGAVLQFTRSIAKEFASRGIRVNAVSPGLIYTEMMPRDAEFSAGAVSLTPMGRGGEPVEIANAMLFLASDDSSFCTGINLVVDGGQSC